MKLNKILITVFMFIILSSFISATGFCELDRELYSPGEIATLTCQCSLPNEEIQLGYIVWFQENGSILQSTSIDSGLCRTSLFGDSLMFPSSYGDYNGTVRFSLNSDGTGDVPNWNNPGDIDKDIFTIDLGAESHCIITDVKVPNIINLGEENPNVFKVLDEITGHPLVGIGCIAIAFGEDETPILVEPYGDNYDFYRTVSGGVGYLVSDFSNDKFKPFTTYEFNLYCQCTNNSENDGVCYDDITGSRLGYKSCSISGLFTTGSDLRSTDSKIYFVVIFTILFFIAVLIYVGRKIENEQIRGLLTYVGFGCIPLSLQVCKTILEINSGNQRLINIVWTFEWVSMILFVFLLMYLFIMFLKSILESYNVKGQE